MSKAKNYFKDIIRNTSIMIISFLLSISILITFAAISWPSSTPSGETQGGEFMSYFDKLKTQCPSGQALQGYDSNLNKICVAISSPVVNGSCGSSSGVCNSGTLSWVNNTSSCGTTATWKCTGANGGTTASCSYDNGACAPSPVNGTCGSSRGSCNSGTLSWTNSTSSCGANATWKCNGSNGGTTASCYSYNGDCEPAQNGECGSEIYSCNIGSTSAFNSTPECGDQVSWTCYGVNGGNPANCSKKADACMYRASVGTEKVDRINGDCPAQYSYSGKCSTKGERVTARNTSAFYGTSQCLATIYECK